mmetsp:Transcript_124479/g.195031  ORF Transcript_124479/g.195031 Transcript_124479/m.195031 type:complete len:122 (-) Transcript_124479:74-439(-)
MARSRSIFGHLGSTNLFLLHLKLPALQMVRRWQLLVYHHRHLLLTTTHCLRISLRLARFTTHQVIAIRVIMLTLGWVVTLVGFVDFVITLTSERSKGQARTRMRQENRRPGLSLLISRLSN